MKVQCSPFCRYDKDQGDSTLFLGQVTLRGFTRFKIEYLPLTAGFSLTRWMLLTCMQLCCYSITLAVCAKACFTWLNERRESSLEMTHLFTDYGSGPGG